MVFETFLLIRLFHQRSVSSIVHIEQREAEVNKNSALLKLRPFSFLPANWRTIEIFFANIYPPITVQCGICTVIG